MNRDYRLYLEDILEAIRRIERYVEGLDFDRFRMVNPKIPSTMDAANLSKMADRGQIYGGIVDGPLALDNAISLEAARIKGIRGEVAGRADILIAPDLEAGNALAKAIIYFASIWLHCYRNGRKSVGHRSGRSGVSFKSIFSPFRKTALGTELPG